MEASLTRTAAKVLEVVPDAIVVVDRDGRIVFMNANAGSLFGRRRNDCVGQPIEMLIPESIREAHTRLRGEYGMNSGRRLMAGGRCLMGLHSDGHEVPVDISLSSLPSSGGGLVIVAVRDANERYEWEEALRRSEEVRRLFAEHVRDIIYRVRLGPPQTFEYLSPAVTAILGYTPDDFYADATLGRRHMRTDDRERRDAWLKSPRLMEEPLTLPMSARDGSLHWFEFRHTPVFDEWGNPIAVEGIARDVTERKLAEEALRESEARLTTVIANLPFSCWAYDLDGRCFLQNAACKTRWGDRIGRRIDELPLDDDTRARWQEQRRRAMSGETVRLEEEYVFEGQSRVDYTIIAPVQVAGKVTAIVGVNIDVTDRQRTQEAEMRAQAAEESERLKDILLSTVSHELRTPITVIRGRAALALGYADQLPRAELKEYFHGINDAAMRLERLVSNLLTMARLDAGALKIGLQPLDLQSVVGEALTMMAASSKRQLDASMVKAGIRIEGDANVLVEVLCNLLENADKYSPDDEAVLISAESRDHVVTVCVRDRGAGVSSDKLDAIFGRFYRSETGSRRPVPGTGLGLAICRSIIEAHGGRIWASLPVDGGFQVCFTLRRPKDEGNG